MFDNMRRKIADVVDPGPSKSERWFNAAVMLFTTAIDMLKKSKKPEMRPDAKRMTIDDLPETIEHEIEVALPTGGTEKRRERVYVRREIEDVLSREEGRLTQYERERFIYVVREAVAAEMNAQKPAMAHAAAEVEAKTKTPLMRVRQDIDDLDDVPSSIKVLVRYEDALGAVQREVAEIEPRHLVCVEWDKHVKGAITRSHEKLAERITEII